MQTAATQDGSNPVPTAVLEAVVDRAAGLPLAAAVAVRHSGEHSNDIAWVEFGDGRTLVIKRARFGWARPRFAAAGRAASLLRDRAGVIAPEHLPVPPDPDGLPLLAYWRIPLPTLREVWPSVPETGRPAVLRSWGCLLRQMHRVTLGEFGALAPEGTRWPGLVAFLQADLRDRLLPAVVGTWPAGVPVVERLGEAVSALGARQSSRAARLVHGDQHMGNVLCAVEQDEVRCVGLIDLETCFAGPAEADLASAEVLHGPLFHQPIPDAGWPDPLHGGYGRSLDGVALAFFRTYHLANMGFHSALIGHTEHAAEVAAAALGALHGPALDENSGGTMIASPRTPRNQGAAPQPRVLSAG